KKYRRPIATRITTFHYIRSVRCYTINPAQFANPIKCGGVMPAMEVTGNVKNMGAVQKFGVVNYCPSAHFQFLDEFSSIENITVSNSYIAGVDRWWMVQHNRPQFGPAVYKIAEGTCVTLLS
ncbi:hypothetical protein PMAYCL1PPCAC_04671, partial [Pristionchus mayeri]